MKKFAVLILALAIVGSIATAAAAQYPPKVKGNQIQGNEQPTQGPLVLPQQVAPNADDTLPFTGADLTLFLVAGLSAVTIGVLVVRRTKRTE
jgi:LPXTG-motif cell wall-anchored protein